MCVVALPRVFYPSAQRLTPVLHLTPRLASGISTPRRRLHGWLRFSCSLLDSLSSVSERRSLCCWFCFFVIRVSSRNSHFLLCACACLLFLSFLDGRSPGNLVCVVLRALQGSHSAIGLARKRERFRFSYWRSTVVAARHDSWQNLRDVLQV